MYYSRDSNALSLVFLHLMRFARCDQGNSELSLETNVSTKASPSRVVFALLFGLHAFIALPPHSCADALLQYRLCRSWKARGRSLPSSVLHTEHKRSNNCDYRMFAIASLARKRSECVDGRAVRALTLCKAAFQRAAGPVFRLSLAPRQIAVHKLGNHFWFILNIKARKG